MAKILKKKMEPAKIVEKVDEIKPKQAANIAPGMVSVVMTHTDLTTLSNLMTICAKTFEKLAIDAAQLNNSQDFNILNARYQLSADFAAKLANCVMMPEPISRDFH
jgi:hypothetical protein